MKFKIGEKETLYEGKFIKVRKTDFLDKEGKPQVWEYIEKNDVIAVLPITDDGKAVLVKNYRVPLEKYVIETPAGLMDHAGEAHEEAIKRELFEETGYTAEKLFSVPAFPYRSGTSANKIYGFIATGLKKVNDNVGDATEDIEVVEVPLKDLTKLWLDPKDDSLFQPEIIAMYQAAIEMGIALKA
ncbi:MAG TPA: NUDIX hydrolase [Candidatus Paceibacterota bacterium]|nr:NUDIX hydrolase [Candidatus Paceibacterota bacterium]